MARQLPPAQMSHRPGAGAEALFTHSEDTRITSLEKEVWSLRQQLTPSKHETNPIAHRVILYGLSRQAGDHQDRLRKLESTVGLLQAGQEKGKDGGYPGSQVAATQVEIFQTLLTGVNELQHASTATNEDIDLLFDECNAVADRIGDFDQRIGAVFKQANDQIGAIERKADQATLRAEETKEKFDEQLALCEQRANERVAQVEQQAADRIAKVQRQTKKRIAKLEQHMESRLLELTETYDERIVQVQQHADEQGAALEAEMRKHPSFTELQANQRIDGITLQILNCIRKYDNLHDRVTGIDERPSIQSTQFEDRLDKLEGLVRALTVQKSNDCTTRCASLPPQLLPIRTNNGQNLDLSVPKGKALAKPPVSLKKENMVPTGVVTPRKHRIGARH